MFLLITKQKAQSALIALCLLLFSGCSSPACRKWELQEVLTQQPCFNAGRLILGPDSNLSHLEMELIRNRSGVRCYINLLFLQAPPLKENPCHTKVDIIFENEEPWIIYPYLFEGGQRLLLPDDVTNHLIQALTDQCSFKIKIGRNQLHAIPDNFVPSYEKLLKLPIADS